MIILELYKNTYIHFQEAQGQIRTGGKVGVLEFSPYLMENQQKVSNGKTHFSSSKVNQ